MKKILFAIASVMTLTLTSCFESKNEITETFPRIVTINTSDGLLKLIADYTEEEIKGEDIENLKTPEQLAKFGLADAKRAQVELELVTDYSNRTRTLTLLQGEKIDIQSVTNRAITDSLRPLRSWMTRPINGGFADIIISNNKDGYLTASSSAYTYPLVWVSEGYLNVMPVIPSDDAGKYYLTAEKVVSDTLYFRLDAAYEPNESKELREDGLQSFDLRTLKNTADADQEQRAKMAEALEAIKEHRFDSIRIVLTGKFEWTKINGKDTIGDMKAITDYFKCEFIQ